MGRFAVRSRFLRMMGRGINLCIHTFRPCLPMKRRILLTCAGLLLAACASGNDVADDATPADSAVVDVLEGRQAPADSQAQGAKTP
jgi:hypothetical protein